MSGLADRILGYLGEQTPAGEKKIKEIEFEGGDKVQCKETGRIGYIVRAYCTGLKDDERLVTWINTPEAFRYVGTSITPCNTMKVSELILLEKHWP